MAQDEDFFPEYLALLSNRLCFEMQVGKLMFEVIVLIDHIGIFMFQFLNSELKVIFLDGLDGAGRLFIRRQLTIAAIGVVSCFLLAVLL